MLERLLKIFHNPKPEPQISPKMQAEMDKLLAAIHNRPVYRELSLEIIAATPDDELDELIIDNLFAIIGADDRDELDIVQNFTPGQQAIYTSWIVEAEIINGGFEQFYDNPSQQYADLAVQGFKILDAPQFTQLMVEANVIFNQIQSNSDQLVSENVADLSFEELDQVFYELNDPENLHHLRIQYIRAHPQEFISS